MSMRTKQVFIQTSGLIAGFMVWVLISSLMPYIQTQISLSTLQIAWIKWVPIIIGSLLRIPIGYWSNKYGARALFSFSFLILLVPIVVISIAHSFFVLLFGAFLLGIGGAVFTIGVTSLPKYFPKERHGFINGVYGAGNVGVAISFLTAPFIVNALGWRSAVLLILVPILALALLNSLFGDKNEIRTKKPFMEQFLEIYHKPKLWAISFFYFITFGSFITFIIYLPAFLVQHFEINPMKASLSTACFVLLSVLFRIAGGWLSDNINPFLLLIPTFLGVTCAGFLLSFTPSLPVYSFGFLVIALSIGIGNGAIFKLVSLYFWPQAGVANGIVSSIGGLGGGIFSLILTVLYQITGNYSIGFMLLSEVSLASLVLVVWLYYFNKTSIYEKIIHQTHQGICVTDQEGIIQKVNSTFTKVTGYSEEEVIGKTPSVLQSGEHHHEFYQNMWNQLISNHLWEGPIWNKRKNKEIYLEWLTIIAIADETGETKNYVGIFDEIANINKKYNDLNKF